MVKKSNVKVECQIARFEDNPKGGVNVLINCKIGMKTWVKEVWLNYDRPISMEEFKRDLKKIVMPTHDDDNLRFVKQEAEKPFTLDIQI